ncbi:MAG: HD-GYP domain-containing protein, partial [Firmicutes bacterium]|nr:HD-GYP domain-containing protein [Bacillota bacterium]
GGSGTLFDPRIALVFANKVEPYPVGTCVRLSDGSRAVVQDIRKDKKRPLLRIQDAGEGSNIIDLSDRNHLNLTISGVVKFALQEAE